MPTEVPLPKLDRIMTEGTIEKWLKRSGEEVRKGDPIALIETEKVSVELNAPESGIFAPRANEGETVKVGSVIAMVLAPGEKIQQEPSQASSLTASPSAPAAGAHEKIEREVPTRLVRASPSARRLARERGVDLTHVQGSGPEGRIVAEDVISFANKSNTAEAVLSTEVPEGSEEHIPLTGWRRAMAERMAASARTAAQVTTVMEVDATELINLRKKLEQVEQYQSVRITLTTFVVKAVACALKENRAINASLFDDKIVLHNQVNVGVAVAIETGGLVVPVIRDAEKKNLTAIANELENLSRKARENRLALHDVSDGTFTITNPGMMGVTFDTPLINVPQSGILGIGAIIKRPAVLDDEIVIRHMMHLSLTYDHRILEGHVAIKFLQRVKKLIENPGEIVAAETSWKEP